MVSGAKKLVMVLERDVGILLPVVSEREVELTPNKQSPREVHKLVSNFTELRVVVLTSIESSVSRFAVKNLSANTPTELFEPSNAPVRYIPVVILMLPGLIGSSKVRDKLPVSRSNMKDTMAGGVESGSIVTESSSWSGLSVPELSLKSPGGREAVNGGGARLNECKRDGGRGKKNRTLSGVV